MGSPSSGSPIAGNLRLWLVVSIWLCLLRDLRTNVEEHWPASLGLLVPRDPDVELKAIFTRPTCL